MPMSGPLARKRDSSLPALEHSIPGELRARAIYVYVITTVGNKGGQFVQMGSAPNFQGGCITLCTCKHKDRAYPPQAGLPRTALDSTMERDLGRGDLRPFRFHSARFVLPYARWRGVRESCRHLAGP